MNVEMRPCASAHLHGHLLLASCTARVFPAIQAISNLYQPREARSEQTEPGGRQIPGAKFYQCDDAWAWCTVDVTHSDTRHLLSKAQNLDHSQTGKVYKEWAGMFWELSFGGGDAWKRGQRDYCSSAAGHQ